MIDRFYISSSQQFEKPASKQTIYCDGAGSSIFRDRIDIELSHWNPNRTPERYKANTSTEICLKFVDDPAPGEWDLVVNNHADVDGLLSVFVLMHSELAIAHRESLIQAADMGDFWGWGDRPAQVLFQEMTVLMNRLEQANVDPQQLYDECLRHALQLIHKGFPENDRLRAELGFLQESVQRIECQEVARTAHNERFVHYAIPESLARQDLVRALCVPEFNAAISDRCLIWPQARAKQDQQRVQLVSIDTGDGWYYDLWYPGYMWAETPHFWRAPGLEFSGSTNGYFLAYQPLRTIVADLQRQETGSGVWRFAEQVAPFDTGEARNYPVVLWVSGPNGEPMTSELSPDEVAPQLAAAFA